jgi:hypothetical protein
LAFTIHEVAAALIRATAGDTLTQRDHYACRKYIERAILCATCATLYEEAL